MNKMLAIYHFSQGFKKYKSSQPFSYTQFAFSLAFKLHCKPRAGNQENSI